MSKYGFNKVPVHNCNLTNSVLWEEMVSLLEDELPVN